MLKPRLTALDEKEILHYLGYGGQALEPAFADQMHRCMAAVRSAAEPRCVYRRFTWRDGSLREAALPLSGADIAAHLAGCGSAVLMAATLGAGVDRLLAAAQVRSVADALIMDACASTAIENVCDNLETDLRRECAAQGFYLTERFSPGYGDLPLAAQGGILAALDAGRAIGLAVTATNIMTPRKSVTAVLGIADAPMAGQGRGCTGCALIENCTYRKEGRACGKR